MKIKDARNIFEINEEDFDNKDLIKKKYRILALKYHPDKNKSEYATSKFQDINLAYETLLKEKNHNTSYETILKEYLNSLLKNETHVDITYNILINIIYKCKEKGLMYFNSLSREYLYNIITILKKHKDIFDIDEKFINEIEEIYKNKTKNSCSYVLNPDINDLLEDNVYKLVINENEKLIPLWHKQVYYTDYNNNDIDLYCIPLLEDNIWVDENNNLFINIEKKISDIMNIDKIPIHIGKHIRYLKNDNIRFVNKQQIILYNCGISKINYHDVMDNSSRSNIIINLTII
tara:strand:+ start:188 stop:1057 length:870 start_codon:yes stop_codon:yes gene_type:complete